jgi:hypothetical protein
LGFFHRIVFRQVCFPGNSIFSRTGYSFLRA